MSSRFEECDDGHDFQPLDAEESPWAICTRCKMRYRDAFEYLNALRDNVNQKQALHHIRRIATEPRILELIQEAIGDWDDVAGHCRVKDCPCGGYESSL